MAKKKDDAKEIKKVLKDKKDNKKEKKEEEEQIYVSSGSYLLDLALSEQKDGGYLLGSVIQISAKDHVGKTLMALNMFAEAKNNKKFKDYKLILDEPEAAMNFPLDKMYGKGMKKRMTFVPTPEERVSPRTVQDWYHSITNEKNYPCIYVLDSFDALTSDDDLNLKGDPGKGGYHLEKAIVASSTFPKIIGPLAKTNSLFFWISQTRANLGMGMEDDTESGGRAIKFYRSYYIKLKKIQTLTKMVRGKKIVVGNMVEITIKKNKVTGKIRTITIPIYNDYGIDDLESMVDWLCERDFWDKPKKSAWIDCLGDFSKGLDKDGNEKRWTRKELILHIETEKLQQKLRGILYEKWMQYESEICTDREPRYV